MRSSKLMHTPFVASDALTCFLSIGVGDGKEGSGSVV
jgi:hypothetical protein